MNKKLRFGIIGCGWIGALKHIPNYANRPETEIVALCDIDTAKAKAAAQKFNLGTAKIYNNYRLMVQDPNLDVVVIATPNNLHCEMALAAFAAGRHVLCEKPMATAAADAQMMIAAAKKAGKKLTVGFQWRWRPECLHLKKLCDEGFFGEIYFARAHGLRRRGVPTWGEYMNPAMNGGGVLWDGAPHSLDLTLWTMNNYDPLSVKANIYNKMKDKPEGNPWGGWKTENFNVEDSGFALVTMKNGATIFVEAAWAINIFEGNDMKTTLCGTKAGVDMFTAGGLRINLIQDGKMANLIPDLTPVQFPGIEPDPDPAEYEARQWIDCIRNDTEPAVKPEEALVVTQIIEGIYKSARTGETVFF